MKNVYNQDQEYILNIFKKSAKQTFSAFDIYEVFYKEKKFVGMDKTFIVSWITEIIEFLVDKKLVTFKDQKYIYNK